MVTGYKRYVALFMACLLTFALIAPASRVNVRAEGEEADAWNQRDNAAELGYPDEEIVEKPKYSPEALKSVVDEAKALGVPNAFYRHNFAEEFNAKSISAPKGVTYKVSKTLDDIEGLETNSVDTGVLANTKIDLGEFDFGNMKVGRVVYNMLAKKNLKGKGYLYFGSDTTPFAAISIKRCGDNELEATKNLSVDVRGANVSGKGHIYLRFEADSAKDKDGKLLDKSGVKGFLYLESMFFTEGSSPVLDFDIDKEVNTIEKINNSKLHTTTGYGVMNVQVPSGFKSEYSDKTFKDETYELDYIKGRGNSTWDTDKKPYKIKLDKSVDMFGMGKCKHWVLLANYYDYTMIRNKFTYDLANRMGLEFSPKSIFVDVVISGEYYGSYQLCQHIRIDKNNVNIDDLEDDVQSEEPGVTGGYLINMGSSWLTEESDTQPSFKLNDDIFRIDKPEYDDDYPEAAKNAQAKYIEDYFHKVDDLVNKLSGDASANASGESWRDYMDEDSLIKYYWMQEFSKNGDAYSGSSTYLYKKRNGKLYWGPVWDFDWVAWGAGATDDNQIKSDYTAFDFMTRAPWIKVLTEYDKDFKAKLVDTWALYKKEFEDAIKDGGTLDQLKKDYYYHVLANYQVRPSNLMCYTEANLEDEDGNLHYKDSSGDAYTLNYYNEIDRLKGFIKDGIYLVDRDINGLGLKPTFSPISFYVDDKKVGEATFDASANKVNIKEVPKDPYKKGYVFTGWYYTDEFDSYCKLLEDSIPYRAVSYGNYIAYDMKAEFVPESEYLGAKKMKFNSDKYYLQLVSEDGVSSTMYFDFENVLGINPPGADKSKLKWFYGSDSKNLKAIDDSTAISFTEEGKYIVQCELNGIKAKTTVIVGCDVIPDAVKFSVADKINVPLKEITDTRVKFITDSGNASSVNYRNMTYISEDSDIAEVDAYGFIYAKKKGKVKVYSIYRTEDGDEIYRTTLITVGNALPDQVQVKSVKRSAKNKIKLTLYKAKGASGYQIAVYKTESDAAANKKAVLKKYTLKKSVTLKSSKFKKCKKLYIKVRAYNMNGKTKQYSEWVSDSIG